jgi:hypothetical protein
MIRLRQGAPADKRLKEEGRGRTLFAVCENHPSSEQNGQEEQDEQDFENNPVNPVHPVQIVFSWLRPAALRNLRANPGQPWQENAGKRS